jgi:hypothetical protein
MIKYILGAVLLVACGGGDKCERAYKKLLEMEKAEGKGGKDDAFVQGAIQKCKDGLKDHPEQGAMLDCIIAVNGTPTVADLDRCTKAAGKGSFSDYQKKGKASEASLQLNRIGKRAKMAFAEAGEFPKGKVALSPATECCASPGAKCPVDPKAWEDPVWKALEFAVDEPSVYRYSYESDGKTFTALAVGDADCDTNMATFTLKGTVDNGNPTVELTEPPKGTY